MQNLHSVILVFTFPKQEGSCFVFFVEVCVKQHYFFLFLQRIHCHALSVEKIHTGTDIHTTMCMWEAGDMSVLYVCVHINKRKSADKHACEVSCLIYLVTILFTQEIKCI